ncbi:Na+/H+ antiporter [Spelaeicoccus albus]|uniref:CPA1 family monovalent cation:H+ antiporter n=1 Tax=Spelaeicoccus albus TaxID=1280376 RepID=A0A7Z0D212_9MICO|nr:Na+/H+ antiporter [Spelaeicoccus albus]NYI67390.1 CPA1 family monovalent cation:H+ antiporter [Spelaeicoccus albus]
MHIEHLLALLAGSLALTAFARWRGWPAPLLVTAAALAASYIPGIPQFTIDSNTILTLVLPPLLFSSALGVSYQDFHQSLRPIRRLGVTLVLATALAAGFVAYALVPDLTLPAAFLIGAVVAPPDAVSAMAIGRKLGLPRKLMTVLAGESLINDATSLTLFKVFLAAATGASMTLGQGLFVFADAVVVGVVVGVALGIAAHWLRMHLDDPTVNVVVGLLLPFVGYVLAEEIGGSGVLAVVAAGLLLGYNAPKTGYASRLQEQPVWSSLDILLEGFVFGLIGIQLKTVISDVASGPRGLLASIAVAFIVFAVVLVVRPLYVFSSHAWHLTLLRIRGRFLPRRFKRRKPPRWGPLADKPDPELDMTGRDLMVMSWTGMRGVVTLAAAASVPAVTDAGEPFPARDLVFLIAFTVTVGTLLLQGLTLPALITRLRVRNPQQRTEDQQAETRLYRLTSEAAMAKLEQDKPEWAAQYGEKLTDAAIERVTRTLNPQNRLMELVADETDRDDDPHAVELKNRSRLMGLLRREMLAVRRSVLVAERDAGRLDEEVMLKIQRELDAEELAMDNSWAARMRS